MRNRLPHPNARIDTCKFERPNRRFGRVPAALLAVGRKLPTAAVSAAVSRNSRRVRALDIPRLRSDAMSLSVAGVLNAARAKARAHVRRLPELKLGPTDGDCPS